MLEKLKQKGGRWLGLQFLAQYQRPICLTMQLILALPPLFEGILLSHSLRSSCEEAANKPLSYLNVVTLTQTEDGSNATSKEIERVPLGDDVEGKSVKRKPESE